MFVSNLELTYWRSRNLIYRSDSDKLFAWLKSFFPSNMARVYNTTRHLIYNTLTEKNHNDKIRASSSDMPLWNHPNNSMISMVELDGKVENGTHGEKRLYPSSMKKGFMQTTTTFWIEDRLPLWGWRYRQIIKTQGHGIPSCLDRRLHCYIRIVALKWMLSHAFNSGFQSWFMNIVKRWLEEN